MVENPRIHGAKSIGRVVERAGLTWRMHPRRHVCRNYALERDDRESRRQGCSGDMRAPCVFVWYML